MIKEKKPRAVIVHFQDLTAPQQLKLLSMIEEYVRTQTPADVRVVLEMIV